MLNFDTELDVARTTRLVRQEEPVSASTAETVVAETVVTSAVTVTRQPLESTGYLAREGEQWDWRDLRDYVVREIESRFGTWPRDQKKEYGIFNRFLTTWGAQAAPIARYVFEVTDGWWMNAPVQITRFCRASDPCFAEVIAQRLATQPLAS